MSVLTFVDPLLLLTIMVSPIATIELVTVNEAAANAAKDVVLVVIAPLILFIVTPVVLLVACVTAPPEPVAYPIEPFDVKLPVN